jgi:hypothetical protein
MRKRGVLQLTLWLNFWVASDTYNSTYLYAVSAIRQVTTLQLITTQLQFCCNNSFSTTMQLPYDYNHNVLLMSFFIHPSKFNTWYYEDFSWFFWNIDIHHPLWLFILDGFGLWHVENLKIAMWHINWTLETYICVCVYLARSVHSHR